MIKNLIYELKTTETLAVEHEKQTINYLMLTGMNHAKLVNMRTASVQHRFVSTNITPAKRYQFTIEADQWRDFNEDSAWLRQTFKDLIAEWGVFLDVTLFYDALAHFRGGEDAVVKEIEVKNGARLLGRQKTPLISPDIAFKISSVTKDERRFEKHFHRFLRYTSLKAIHWINFNHQKVVFKTITK